MFGLVLNQIEIRVLNENYIRDVGIVFCSGPASVCVSRVSATVLVCQNSAGEELDMMNR